MSQAEPSPQALPWREDAAVHPAPRAPLHRAGVFGQLPATPFFLLAAYFFSRSSPRLEAWVLNLPQVGPVVRDYRAGRGIPLRAKALATALALLGAFLSLLRLPHPLAQALVVGLIAYGVYFIWKKVPTKTPTGQGR